MPQCSCLFEETASTQVLGVIQHYVSASSNGVSVQLLCRMLCTCSGDISRNGSRPASAAGSSHSNAVLQLLAGGSVEPAVTAAAIRRRKAAAVSTTVQQLRVFHLQITGTRACSNTLCWSTFSSTPLAQGHANAH
jgi:hypothetical protein